MKKLRKHLKKGFKALLVFLGICIILNVASNLIGKKNSQKSDDPIKDLSAQEEQINTDKTKTEESKLEQETLEENLKSEENLKRKELEKKYFFVSPLIERNNKKYFKVRQKGVSGYGWVDYETLEEVIKVGTYDVIGNEIIFDGKSYVSVSVLNDEGFASGILSLDTFTEVIPCKVYRDVDINKNEIECLQIDRSTVDIYQHENNVLTKKYTKIDLDNVK